jgi:hypothetical protein
MVGINFRGSPFLRRITTRRMTTSPSVSCQFQRGGDHTAVDLDVNGRCELDCHCKDPTEQEYSIIWMQNNAGHKLWAPNDLRVGAMLR